MRTITKKMLRKVGGLCSDGLHEFDKIYPKGFKPTLPNCRDLLTHFMGSDIKHSVFLILENTNGIMKRKKAYSAKPCRCSACNFEKAFKKARKMKNRKEAKEQSAVLIANALQRALNGKKDAKAKS